MRPAPARPFKPSDLDKIASTRGALPMRGAAGWSVLAPGTAGLFLQSSGAGADPIYAAPAAEPRPISSVGGGISSQAFGALAASAGSSATAVGNAATAAGASGAAFGASASAGATSATALGVGSSASQTECTAVGAGALAFGATATAIGRSALASGTATTAVGKSAAAGGTSGTAVGASASAGASGSLAVGASANAGTGTDTTALGTTASATALSATAVGKSAVASAADATALGAGATASAADAIAIGRAALADVAGAAVIGAAAYPVRVRCVPANTAGRPVMGGSIVQNALQVGNVGTGEDTLSQLTMKGALLNVNLDSFVFEYGGTFAANANAKRLRLKFGATMILDTGALALNGGAFRIRGRVMRTGAATQKAIAEIVTSAALLPSSASFTLPTEVLSGDVDFILTGEAVADNDIVKEMAAIDWKPAGA